MLDFSMVILSEVMANNMIFDLSVTLIFDLWPQKSKQLYDGWQYTFNETFINTHS